MAIPAHPARFRKALVHAPFGEKASNIAIMNQIPRFMHLGQKFGHVKADAAGSDNGDPFPDDSAHPVFPRVWPRAESPRQAGE